MKLLQATYMWLAFCYLVIKVGFTQRGGTQKDTSIFQTFGNSIDYYKNNNPSANLVALLPIKITFQNMFNFSGVKLDVDDFIAVIL